MARRTGADIDANLTRDLADNTTRDINARDTRENIRDVKDSVTTLANEATGDNRIRIGSIDGAGPQIPDVSTGNPLDGVRINAAGTALEFGEVSGPGTGGSTVDQNRLLLAGGTARQVLGKVSDTDYDYGFFDAATDYVERDEWQVGVQYAYKNVVFGTTGDSYACLILHVSTNETQPETGANWRNFWRRLIKRGRPGDSVKGDKGDPGSGLNARGPWTRAETYNPLDVVDINNGSYICLRLHTASDTNSPIGTQNRQFWMVNSLGTRGPQGAQGRYQVYAYLVQATSADAPTVSPTATGYNEDTRIFENLSDPWLSERPTRSSTQTLYIAESEYDPKTNTLTLFSEPFEFTGQEIPGPPGERGLSLVGRGMWLANQEYAVLNTVTVDGTSYFALLEHTSTAAREPGVGADWETYWQVLSGKGNDGTNGWSPILAVVSTGNNFVLQVTDWTGGTGVRPTSGRYLGTGGFVANIAQAVNIRGGPGTNGWTPVFSLITSGQRVVYQVTDWTGGTGTTPATGQYVGSSGLVSNIAQAINVRGLQGSNGWSPTFAIVNDGARRVVQIPDWTGGGGNKPQTGRYISATGLTTNIGDAVDIRGAPGTGGGGGGGDGNDGWSPVFSIVVSGQRRVLRVASWTGGGGTPPASGVYLGPSGFVTQISAAIDIRGGPGANGNNGWTAVLAAVADGNRVVHQVTDWTGGTGAKPATGRYVGSTGFVTDIADATDIKGQGFNWRGDWDGDETYEPGDLTRSDRSVWLAETRSGPRTIGSNTAASPFTERDFGLTLPAGHTIVGGFKRSDGSYYLIGQVAQNSGAGSFTYRGTAYAFNSDRTRNSANDISLGTTRFGSANTNVWIGGFELANGTMYFCYRTNLSGDGIPPNAQAVAYNSNRTPNSSLNFTINTGRARERFEGCFVAQNGIMYFVSSATPTTGGPRRIVAMSPSRVRDPANDLQGNGIGGTALPDGTIQILNTGGTSVRTLNSDGTANTARNYTIPQAVNELFTDAANLIYATIPTASNNRQAKAFLPGSMTYMVQPDPPSAMNESWSLFVPGGQDGTDANTQAWARVGNSDPIPVNKLGNQGPNPESWAEDGNGDRIPDAKIPSSIPRTQLTTAQVQQQIQGEVESWALDDTTLIPANKLRNAPTPTGLRSVRGTASNAGSLNITTANRWLDTTYNVPASSQQLYEIVGTIGTGRGTRRFRAVVTPAELRAANGNTANSTISTSARVIPVEVGCESKWLTLHSRVYNIPVQFRNTNDLPAPAVTTSYTLPQTNSAYIWEVVDQSNRSLDYTFTPNSIRSQPANTASTNQNIWTGGGVIEKFGQHVNTVGGVSPSVIYFARDASFRLKFSVNNLNPSRSAPGNVTLNVYREKTCDTIYFGTDTAGNLLIGSDETMTISALTIYPHRVGT